MPVVGTRHFPYTERGKEQAAAAAQKAGIPAPRYMPNAKGKKKVMKRKGKD